MPDPIDFGERAVNAAQNLIKRGQEVAKREARAIQLQTQLSRMRSQRLRLLGEMGEKVFDLFQRDLVKNQELRLLCQQIRGLDAEMEMKREEIEQLRRSGDGDEAGIDADPIPPEPEGGILDDDEVIRD